MKQKLPTRRMRRQPDLEQLKRQAKELQGGFAAGDEAAVREVNAHYRAADPLRFALYEAQLALARSYGFDSWAKLKAYVDGVTVRRLADAVGAGDMAMVRTMLRARPELADLTMSYGDERRPIHFAVMSRLPEMVRLLMRHGASAREGIHPHRDATRAWTMAKERGYSEIVAVIEEEERRRPSVEPESEPEAAPIGDEAARAAVASGDAEWLRERHAKGELVNPVRWSDGGLLTVAARHDRLDMLRLLLDFGFDPDERVSSGEGDWVAYSQGFPLWECAARGRREMAELLLERGASPNVHVDSSGSAVYSAYSHRQWEMVELLRRHGGIVTADIAAIYRQTELARQMLVDESVAVELLHYGASGGDPEIVRMALERIDLPRDDPKWFRWLTEPLSFWHHIPWLYAGNREFDRGTYLTCFRLILQRCSPNVVGGFGRTALHEVASMGSWVTDEEAAAFAVALLEAGAETAGRDDLLKSTALGWACRWGREGVARVLLERGADPVEASAEEWAHPRAWAEKMGHTGVVAVLREYGG
ncbi:MAG: ankyrin repeat domain-containing protein [Acidobacteria bacterium]|nr:ankyrin repeat domain-containing protein [Acidobacteriota bacterium]